MTTPNEHRFIHECRDCDYPDGVEYVGDHCARCPLCRFRIDLERAWAELHNSESYRVIEKRTFHEFQDDLNEMTASRMDRRRTSASATPRTGTTVGRSTSPSSAGANMTGSDTGRRWRRRKRPTQLTVKRPGRSRLKCRPCAQPGTGRRRHEHIH